MSIINRLKTWCETTSCFGLDSIGKDCADAIVELDSLRQRLAECQARESERIKALQEVTKLASSYICAHDETYRGGAIWEICSLCGAKWADDEGGKPTFKWPKAIIYANEALALPNDATALNELIAERTADKETEVKHLLGKLTLADNAIAELTAELQSTRLQMITDFGQYQEAHEKVKELTAQRDAAMKDAERYRWLRSPTQDVGNVLDKRVGNTVEGYGVWEYRAGGELDNAIDAAIANCKEQK